MELSAVIHEQTPFGNVQEPGTSSDRPWVSSNYRGLGDPFASCNEHTLHTISYAFTY